MKILLISWYFPPINDVGAIRIARLAEFLRDQGHDVHVLTGDRTNPDRSLSTGFPESQVTRTTWFDVNALFRFKRAGSAELTPAINGEPGRQVRTRVPDFRQKLKSALTDLYIYLTWIPDHQVGWIPYAKRAGAEMLTRDKFDLIYASGPPFSAFVIARSLSRQFRVPWVAEYRDAWSRYVYNPKPAWREFIDSTLESRVTSTALAIVGISEPWRRYYEEQFGLPTIAIYNGIDAISPPGSDRRSSEPDKPVSVVYVGAMYHGLRDPSPLYAAIKHAALSPSDIRVHFYGPKAAEIFPLAEKAGVTDFVELHERISHQQSLEIQRAADILLLLQSPDDPRNVPAKVFEYFGSRRPIVGMGLDEGIPAQLIRERSVGCYTTDPSSLASQLKDWIIQKRTTGSIADVPASAFTGLSRVEQFAKLDHFLCSMLVKQ